MKTKFKDAFMKSYFISLAQSRSYYYILDLSNLFLPNFSNSYIFLHLSLKLSILQSILQVRMVQT